MISAIINLLIIALAIPVGFWIAHLCRDELVDGRKWFFSIIVVSVIVGIVSLSSRYDYVSHTLVFVIIVCFISVLKSYDKRWVKKRI